MTDLIPINTQFPAAKFRWLARSGDLYRVQDMETSHLFNTVKMVWNHSVPEEHKIDRNHKRYTFGNAYSYTYIRLAMYCMLRELQTRQLTVWQREVLEFMASKYRDVEAKLQFRSDLADKANDHGRNLPALSQDGLTSMDDDEVDDWLHGDWL